MTVETVRMIPDLRERLAEWRRNGASIGMVPTMGALHEGHLALLRRAKAETGRVIVTLFVNPTQFAPTEDLGSYPRDEANDRAKIETLGADILFAPVPAEIYPPGFATQVIVGGPGAGLESDFRPHFFAGVATVVAKLLLIGSPDRAYFGEKDYQQLLVVKQLVRDLDIPTQIVGCPTIREPDGLALSSRNRYLGPEDRVLAPKLHATMVTAAEALRRGGDIRSTLAEARSALERTGFSVDYLDVRNAETLAAADDLIAAPLRMLAAVRLGRTRLIDNIPV